MSSRRADSGSLKLAWIPFFNGMTEVGVVILGDASRQQSLPNGGNYGPEQRG